jgi:hypothetical protein
MRNRQVAGELLAIVKRIEERLRKALHWLRSAIYER